VLTSSGHVQSGTKVGDMYLILRLVTTLKGNPNLVLLNSQRSEKSVPQ
jgi:hypothetical protein